LHNVAGHTHTMFCATEYNIGGAYLYAVRLKMSPVKKGITQ